jgi:aryl-alcohol dehydrogenase-like predicted oxidoreductase
MKYRKLGETDLEVSEVAVGCSGYWGNRSFPEKKAEAIIFEAFEKGINFFDTGHNYCNFNAEPRLGRIVRKLLSNNDRSKLIISTKAGTIIPSARIFSNRKKVSKNFSPDYIEKTCMTSIHNLNCDYLDIFQLHGIGKSQITDPLIERLFSMKQKGMFRYLGVNTHSESDMLWISKNAGPFDMVLLDYNVLQLDREFIISELHKARIGVVAGTVLAQGHLVDKKIGSIKSFADIWYLARAIMKPTGRQLSRNSEKMRQALLSSNNMTAAQAAFSYILENKGISSCIFGTTKISNLLEVIEATNKTLHKDCRSLIQKSFNELQEKISA